MVKQAEIDAMWARVDADHEEWLKTRTNEETHPEWYLNSTQKFNMSCLGLAPTWIHKRDVCRKCQNKKKTKR